MWHVPVPTNSQTVQANPTGGDFLIYLPTVTTSLPTIIPASTNILTDETNQYLVSIAADSVQLVFSQTTPELNNVDPGEVIVSGIHANAPNGYLRKVLSKQLLNGQVVLTTSPASLEEAIEQASVWTTYDFTPADIVEVIVPAGVTVAANQAPAADFDAFTLTLNNTLLGGSLAATGSINFNMAMEFGFNIRRFSLDDLRMILHATETATLQLVAAKDAGGGDEYEVARYRLRSILIWVGNFPIAIQPTIVVVVGVDGTVSASLTSSLTQVAKVSGGVRYADGDLSPVKEFTRTFQALEPHITAQMAAKAYAGAGLELAFYSTSPLTPELGVKVRAGPSIEADESLYWVLKGTLEVDLLARLKFIRWELADVQETIASVDTVLLQAQKCTPLEISTNQFVAYSSASTNDFSGEFPLFDSQEDGKLLSGDQAAVKDVTLSTGASASAGSVSSQTTSVGSVEYKSVTNALGIPSNLGATVTFDTAWNYQINPIWAYAYGGMYGYYVITLTNLVDGDFVFTYSSEVSNSSTTDTRDGYITYARQGGGSPPINEQFNIPANGNNVVTRSVTANTVHLIYFAPFGMDFTFRRDSYNADPLVGSGAAHSVLQWEFIPAGSQ
jgi:hypothetical protein